MYQCRQPEAQDFALGVEGKYGSESVNGVGAQGEGPDGLPYGRLEGDVPIVAHPLVDAGLVDVHVNASLAADIKDVEDGKGNEFLPPAEEMPPVCLKPFFTACANADIVGEGLCFSLFCRPDSINQPAAYGHVLFLDAVAFRDQCYSPRR